ncbi:MAG: hypothetical protein ABFE07_28030 [Armatimonadia bacterium]
MPPNHLATLPGFRGVSPLLGQPSGLQHGVVVAVDQERWTVTVELHESGMRQYDIPLMSPYFFHERGQGMYCVPETGAQCIVADCWGQYFVLGFLPPVDPTINEVTPDGEDLSRLASDQASASATAGAARTSYRNRRDGDMLPGDYCFTTRARNRIKMFTNGNVLVQASRLCTRIYSKLRNIITDICVNYILRTPGGEVNWINDADDGTVRYERTVKANIDDAEPSFVEEIGAESSVVNRRVQTEAGVETMSEQLNADGSAAYKFVAGAHEVNVTPAKIEIKALSGVHTVTLDATGVHIVSGANFDVVTPTGTLAVNETGGQWSVVGDLVLASTGNMYLQPVGNLYLPG